jgi:hypothetical protein
LTYFLWNCAELNIGIIAASIPPLRPLVSRWFADTTNRFRSGNSNSNQYGGRYGNRHGYGIDSSGRGIPLSDTPESDWQKKSRDREHGVTISTTRMDSGDGSSEEGILASPPKGSILRSTEVKVQGQERDKEHHGRAF